MAREQNMVGTVTARIWYGASNHSRESSAAPRRLLKGRRASPSLADSAAGSVDVVNVEVYCLTCIGRQGCSGKSDWADEKGTAMTARALVRIAHGGGGSLAAPNSLEGIKRSLEFGVDMIEIDVRCTRDGALILSHDDALGGSLIRAASLDELRRAEPRIATLDDALALVNGQAVVNLDIKDAASIKCVGAAVRARGGIEQCVVSCLKR